VLKQMRRRRCWIALIGAGARQASASQPALRPGFICSDYYFPGRRRIISSPPRLCHGYATDIFSSLTAPMLLSPLPDIFLHAAEPPSRTPLSPVSARVSSPFEIAAATENISLSPSFRFVFFFCRRQCLSLLICYEGRAYVDAELSDKD